MVKSGCAGCHNEGGVDPMARFFMSYPGSRVSEIDGNINFDYDHHNFYDPKLKQYYPWYEGPLKLSGFGYVPSSKIIALNPEGYYGRDKTGLATDSWKGRSVTEGIAGLNAVLLAEPKFTQCTTRSIWRMLLGRDVAAREAIQFGKIVAKLREKDQYTVEDVVLEIVMSEAFRKEN